MTEPTVGKKEKDNTLYEPIFVARQPIYTREQLLWGFELFFRHSAEAFRAEFDDAEFATARVITDGFMIAQTITEEHQRIMINIPSALLLKDGMLSLPSTQCIPELFEGASVTDEFIASCKELKKNGYLLALDDYVGQEELEPLLSLVDIIKVDVLNLSYSELFALKNSLQGYSATLLAEKIEDNKKFNLCRTMGFELFQGFYFGRPEVFAGRKVSAAENVKLGILRELNGEYEVKRLSALITQDVSLSYRLLRYVNSPFLGLQNTVRSLEQALVVLGERMVRQWLMVVLLSDLNPSPGAREVTFLSIQRARFLYNMASNDLIGTYGEETMFMIGLFSRLDFLLGKPMEELVVDLPLDGIIKDAFCGHKNVVRDMLDYLDALEEARWEVSDALARAMGIQSEIAAELRNESMVWAANILNNAEDTLQTEN